MHHLFPSLPAHELAYRATQRIDYSGCFLPRAANTQL